MSPCERPLKAVEASVEFGSFLLVELQQSSRYLCLLCPIKVQVYKDTIM